MNPDGALTDLAERMRTLLLSLSAPALAPFLAAWPPCEPRRLDPEGDATLNAAPLAVLRCLPQLDMDGKGFGQAVLQELRRVASGLPWRQTYTGAEAEAAFLSNYGWTEIIGATAPWRSSHLLAGFLLLGPDTLYPRHAHLPEEIYVPICGTAHWQQGDGPWRCRPPGSVIHHASAEPHAMRTADRPLLAVYAWRGDDLQHKARFTAAPVT